MFSGPLTQERLRMMFSRVASRTELLPYQQPGRVLKCLDRLLAEAGRSK